MTKVDKITSTESQGTTVRKRSAKRSSAAKVPAGTAEAAASTGSLKRKGVVYLLDIKPGKRWQGGNSEQILIDIVRGGVTRKTYDRIVKATGLSVPELAGLIHISERTLRRYTAGQTFPAEQSGRIVEIARLYSRGEEVFESFDRFNEWMGRPQVACGNEMPKTYLDTSIGIGLIMDALGRMEHGIFS